jgi:CheY-like chemotaxis protein
MAATRTILIVDDDQDGAVSLGLLFQLLGHDVTVRYDGRGALELLETARPQIVFLDLAMPGMDGYELCRQIRDKPWGADPFVFALTGWTRVESRALLAGFDACLLKPCSLDKLDKLLADPAAASTRVRGGRRDPRRALPRKAAALEQA